MVKDKDQALESRETEVKNLRSRIDAMAEQISQSELAVRKARKEAASKVQEAEQVIESLKANIIVLDATRKAQHRQVEQIVGSTDPSINDLDRDSNHPAIDLNGQFQNETEAGEAEALANNQAQATTKVVAGEQSKTVEEKSTTIPAAGVAPNVVDAGRETVSPEAFVRIIASFSEFANVIETIASLILRDHVRAFGESLETFPQKRFPDLLDSLSNEISDNKLQADFRERVGVTLG